MASTAYDEPAQNTTNSLIGVAICITGNICISLALNLQKLSHIRLANACEGEGVDLPLPPRRLSHPSSESTPLLGPTPPSHRPSIPSDARASSQGAEDDSKVPRRPSLTLSTTSSQPALAPRKRRPRVDKAYLRSPLWWTGLMVLNIGELGNFVGYSFAPASLIAPLGTAALVANCVFAPLVLGEPSRKKDFLGCALAILGGITVVYASKSSDKKLLPHEILLAISQPLFISYSAVSVVVLLVLGWLSRTSWGDMYVMIDVGICAIAGGFTVMSTKAISSFINLLFLDTFKYWITYPIVLVLLTTALIQVNFLNKSLQRHPSRIVIPSQFVSFSLAAIVGSAMVYRDFDEVEPSQFLNFVFGCSVSALGVYVLTREPSEEPPLPLVPPPPPAVPHVLRHRQSQASLHSRTISVTLGGGQYLLAQSQSQSPGREGITRIGSLGREGARSLGGTAGARWGDLEEGSESQSDEEH